MSRPPIGPSIHVRLPPEMLEIVGGLAADYEVKRAEMIRILVEEALRARAAFDAPP